MDNEGRIRIGEWEVYLKPIFGQPYAAHMPCVRYFIEESLNSRVGEACAVRKCGRCGEEVPIGIRFFFVTEKL